MKIATMPQDAISSDQRADAMRKYKREWARKAYAKDPARRCLNAKNHRDRNLERVKSRERAYEEKNRQKRRAKSLKYYYANRQRLILANRAYVKTVVQERRASKRKSTAKHRLLKTNSYFATLLRTSLLSALKGKAKQTSALKLLGCSLDYFREHLQSKFRDGMAWNNHGKIWHIDHIKPCASFNLAHMDEQKLCFHFSNMQPLLVLENLRKGDTV